MSGARHSWEDAPEPWELLAGGTGGVGPNASNVAAGDVPDPWGNAVDGFGQPDSDSEHEEPPRTPGAEMVDYCTKLLHERSISSKDFSIIMHFAGLAGVQEAVPFGFRPDAPSGHYQRHVNSALGLSHNRNKFYNVTVTGHSKADLSRTPHKCPTFVPHEMVEDNILDDSEVLQQLHRATQTPHELPPAYWEHPVVKEHGSVENPVFPSPSS